MIKITRQQNFYVKDEKTLREKLLNLYSEENGWDEEYQEEIKYLPLKNLIDFYILNDFDADWVAFNLGLDENIDTFFEVNDS